MNKIYFLIFVIFINSINSNSDDNKSGAQEQKKDDKVEIKCTVAGIEYKIGEVFTDLTKLCQICKCEKKDDKTGEVKCADKSCDKFDIKSLIDKKCFDDLKCKGIFYKNIEKAEAEAASMKKRWTIIFVTVGLLLASVVLITVVCCIKGCCNTCMGK